MERPDLYGGAKVKNVLRKVCVPYYPGTTSPWNPFAIILFPIQKPFSGKLIFFDDDTKFAYWRHHGRELRIKNEISRLIRGGCL